jgi:hypothetical protein
MIAEALRREIPSHGDAPQHWAITLLSKPEGRFSLLSGLRYPGLLKWNCEYPNGNVRYARERKA